MGFLNRLLGRREAGSTRPNPMRATPDGRDTRLIDPRTGLRLTFLGEGRLLPGSEATADRPAFDGAFVAANLDLELRLRLDRLEPEADPVERAAALCLAFVANRAAQAPQVVRALPVIADAWSVDGAASALYELARPEGPYSHEDCQVLVRGDQAVVLTKLFATRTDGWVPPEAWQEFNEAVAASLRWHPLEPIGSASMKDDGTIVMFLRAEMPGGGPVGHATITYPPEHPEYRQIRLHLVGLRPGEEVIVPPFEDE